ncbi:MAG: polysaccharide deacetylase family protein [Clostridia bacterium]|nr:polysaccharide deacetylase family protein [Clostridia bacterium]
MKSPVRNHWKSFFLPTIVAVCLSLALLSGALLTVRGFRRGSSESVPAASPVVLAPIAETPVPAFAPAAIAQEAIVPTLAPATPEPQPFEYLPVIHSGDTSEKMIAITVDDCYQMGNLKSIARLAHQNGGRLTLFPIGQNVTREGMDEILQICAFQLGFEIENHTWSHARIFRLSEDEMASEIWKQRAAVNRALGVNYEQHFFRLMGGDGEYDQRTHNYLKQLGYRGVADWTLSGSNAELDQIASALRPGAIFLFHTTDEDTEKLKKFIPYAVEQGYSLVTLNELLGLPENAVSDLSTFDSAQPAPAPYAPDYREQKKGDYSWATVLIQRRLVELGFLDGSAKSALEDDLADGVYGDSTCLAVEAFQAACGLPSTGVADVETQKMLFTDSL